MSFNEEARLDVALWKNSKTGETGIRGKIGSKTTLVRPLLQ